MLKLTQGYFDELSNSKLEHFVDSVILPANCILLLATISFDELIH